MPKLILLAFITLLSQTAMADSFSKYVGQAFTLPIPKAPQGAVTSWAYEESDNTIVTNRGTSSPSEAVITKYFTGSEIIQCNFTYTFIGVDGRQHVANSYDIHRITCIDNKISISAPRNSMKIGESMKISYKFEHSYYDATPTVTWETSNSNAFVDYNGNVTAKKSGKVTIYAKSNLGSNSASWEIDIEDVEPIEPTPSLSASPGSGTYEKGTKIYLSASMSDATIRYTTDGSTPTTSSRTYSSPLTLNESFTLKARAYISSGEGGEVLTCRYTVEEPESSPLSYNIISAKLKTVEVVANDDGCEGDIVIPEKVNIGGITYTVVRIGDFAFANRLNGFDRGEKVTSIQLPNTLKEIGKCAFFGCANITTISVPETVIRIESNAFGWCKNLNYLYLGKNLSLIDGDVFFAFPLDEDDKYVLKEIKINPENPYFSVKEGVLFDKNLNVLVCCPPAKEGKYYIPKTVYKIGKYAFASCSLLKSIVIPDNVNDRMGSIQPLLFNNFYNDSQICYQT